MRSTPRWHYGHARDKRETLLGRRSNLARYNLLHFAFDPEILGSFEDGADIGTTVVDRSGKNNHGYFVGGATSSAKTIGKLGQALTFNGTNNYVNLPESASALSPGTGNFAISTWVKWNVQPGDGDIVIFARNDSTADQISMDIVDATQMSCSFIDNNNEAQALDQDTTFIANNLRRWIHYVCVRQGTTVSLYTDGVFTVSDTNASLSNVNVATADAGRAIGTGGSFGTESVPAVIDDVRMYSRALTAAEVKQLHKLGTATVRQ